MTLKNLLRLSIGALYTSGHVGDGAISPELASTNVNDARVFARFVYDLGPYLRAGATFAPILHASPAWSCSRAVSRLSSG